MDTIDPWAMTITPVGTAQPGAFTVNPPKADTVFRFMPYPAGEPLRPEVRIHATPTEGMPPLTVAFKAVSDAAQANWDFGDGNKATGREAKHTFAQPGIHTVTLKVTDQNGASAIAYAEVLTDRDVTKPIVQAGLAGNEQPTLKLHGTAKRGADGALLLADGAPWGWVQAGDKPLEDLRGVRSFTISGWLRPASLATGAGGNRIVFCLNNDGDGIDLVCHTDGRLRLSVNQWPDGIKNDSSAGKLVVGKWTFFAVTYDASRPRENVSWYFSPPLEAPGAADVKLDRKTTYNNGPVGADLRDKGFTVIQTVALAELRFDQPNAFGHLPIEPNRPDRPLVKDGTDNDYWDDVERGLRLAEEHQLNVGLLPTWGKYVTTSWQSGLVDGFFTAANAEAYGRFLGSRF